MSLSRVIRRGLLHDGLGGEPQLLDVGIDGDRIAAIGHIPAVDCPEIDATGLVVAPGLINVLSHVWQTIQLDGSLNRPGARFEQALTLIPTSIRMSR